MRLCFQRGYLTRSRPRIARNLDVHHQSAAAIGLGVVVGGVVGDVAVDHPLAWFERLPDHVVALVWTDIDRVGQETLRGRQGSPSRATTWNGRRGYAWVDETAVGADEANLASNAVSDNSFRSMSCVRCEARIQTQVAGIVFR